MLGTPVSVGSIATAMRSARASALNIASMMWWAFVPASTVTWRVSLAFAATARKNSSASSWSKLPIAPGGRRRVEREQAAAGDIDRGRRPRLVHRHGRLSVADDPGAVAERLIERLADADADVLDGVVGAGLQIAGGGHRQVEAAVAREQVEHVVKESNPGRALARAGPVQRQADADVGLAGGALDLSGTGHHV